MLTKLQRLGISTLLVGIRYHGIITFTYNAIAKFYNMMVKCSEREMIFHFNLEQEENIDVGVLYKCVYDDEFDVFKIITLDEKGHEC